VSVKGAIGYARVSTDEQARENNSAVQNKKITAYCEENGLNLLKIFQGSESARTTKRPVFQELLSYCRQHRRRISHVIVADLSRLARNAGDQAQTYVFLNQLGIALVSIDDPITDDSAVGKLSRSMIGAFNEFFSNSLSERTRYRMQAAVKAGRFPWPAAIGYRNVNKKLHVDSERAPLIRQAFELIASGRYATSDAVLKVVTAMGLTTRTGRSLSKQSFARMLSNPIYAGLVVSGDIRVRGNHEPIIADDLFEAVQTRLKTKGIPHKRVNEDFPLRGIVRCAKCSKPLTAAWAKGRKERYPRYWCWTPGCRAVGISRSDLERQFVSLLARMEPTAELLTQLPERIANQWRERKERIATDAARLTNRLAEKKALNQKALIAKLNGEISADDYDAFKKANAEEVFQIEAARAEHDGGNAQAASGSSGRSGRSMGERERKPASGACEVLLSRGAGV
jgi:DNA invertase Pin-like site-specific DNA recombinase